MSVQSGASIIRLAPGQGSADVRWGEGQARRTTVCGCNHAAEYVGPVRSGRFRRSRPGTSPRCGD